MKQYFADILTFSRFILSILLIVFGFLNFPIYVGLLIFIFAELTDSFDGTCAKKWSFKKGHEPKYRKYAAKYDMFIDLFLWLSTLIFFIVRVNKIAGLIMLASVAILCGIIELVVYGKFLGHPDDFTKKSLCAKNFNLAKIIIMTRRMFYFVTIIVVALWMLIVCELSAIMKVVIVTFGIVICLFLWFFLEQRRKNISRDAVDIEKTMLKKSQK